MKWDTRMSLDLDQLLCLGGGLNRQIRPLDVEVIVKEVFAE